MEILTLNLLSPLFYIPIANPNPFEHSDGEELYLFELDEIEQNKFEPDKNKLLNRLVSGGKKTANPPSAALLSLPKGSYLFAQTRETLCRDDILSLAVELQQEGLWQKLRLGKDLYIRYLYEDENFVTQIFRPIW